MKVRKHREQLQLQSLLIPLLFSFRVRVIQSTGVLGGYMWGQTRKKVIVAWEGLRKHHEGVRMF
ncbi:MAG TPA: hypothetical protein VLC28_02455 [Flavitalea sp.]|nr:hypothetical protein [Flavitalea sp.]